MDKLVMYVGSSDQRRECISCGYTDSLADVPPLEEPTTRVNRARPGEATLPHEPEIQVLRLPGDKP
jgi:Zn ribbon nucleic-acid-binding protein